MSETTTMTREELQEELLDADAPCTAELAECTCPDFCERDHDNE
ncbi:MAG: hypothetical protein ACRDLM_07040 [Gaiellaceae bacterium]